MEQISASKAQSIKPIQVLGTGPLRRLAWTPNCAGLIVATGSGVWVFDTHDPQKQLHQYGGVHNEAAHLTLDSKGHLISFGGSLSREIPVLATDTGTEVSRFALEHGTLTSLLMNPNGTLLTSTQSQRDLTHTLVIWEIESRETVGIIPHQRAVFGVAPRAHAFSPSGRYLAYPDANGSIVLWEIPSRSPRISLDAGGYFVTSIAFNRDETLLAAAGPQGALSVWNIDETSPTHGLPVHIVGGQHIGKVQFSDEGSQMISATFGRRAHGWSIHVHDTSTWQQLMHIRDVVGSDQGMDISAGGALLACTSLKSEVQLWDLRNHSQIGVLGGHKWGRVQSVVFNPQGALLASGSLEDQTVRIWDLQDMRQRSVIRGFSSSRGGLSFAGDGRTLAVAEGNDIARVWNTESGEMIMDAWGRGDRRAMAVAISPAGDRLAARRSTTVTVHEVPSGRPVFVVKNQKKSSNKENPAIAFSNNGQLLAFDGQKKTIPVWDINSREQVRLLEHGSHGWPASIAFGPTGAILAVATQKAILIWDLDESRIIAQRFLKGETRKPYVAFGKSPHRLFIGDSYGWTPPSIWDWQKDEIVYSLSAHHGRTNFALSSDLSILAIANDDGVIGIWDMKQGLVLNKFQAARRFGVRDICFSPDNRILAVVHDCSVDVYSVG